LERQAARFASLKKVEPLKGLKGLEPGFVVTNHEITLRFLMTLARQIC
jgi:hypothetical protein